MDSVWFIASGGMVGVSTVCMMGAIYDKDTDNKVTEAMLAIIILIFAFWFHYRGVTYQPDNHDDCRTIILDNVRYIEADCIEQGRE